METCRRRGPAVLFLFWFLMAFELCTCLNHEGVALLRFKEMLDADPCFALLDWDDGNASPCSWLGVECSDDGRVMALNLANLGLKGVLPPEIGKLTHMHSLTLRNNSFYGIIPTEIGNLQELKVLDLGYNNFNGPIPSELRNIVSLEFLFLKGNRLSSGLPVELHELTRLCESQVHKDPTLSNRASTARNKRNATIRRLLASQQKHSQKNRILGSETSVLPPVDMIPLVPLPPDLRQNPKAPPLPPSRLHATFGDEANTATIFLICFTAINESLTSLAPPSTFPHPVLQYTRVNITIRSTHLCNCTESAPS